MGGHAQTLWALKDAMECSDGGCALCGETEFSASVEAFEVTGQLICAACADDMLVELEEAETFRLANPLEPGFRRLG